MVCGNATQTVLGQTVLGNRAIRIMTFAPFGNIYITSVYKELKLLKLKEVHALETGKFVFKEKNDLLLTEIGNYFKIDSNERPHNHFVRHARTPRIICNLQTGEKSIQFGRDAALEKHTR